MHRIVSIVLIALALVACGGGDDDDDDASSADDAPTATVASAAPTSAGSSPAGSTQPAAVPSAPTPTESTASVPTATTAASDDTESVDGAPTHASSDFPDVQVPLEVGSSGEVGSMDPDPFGNTESRDENSRVKVTITEIMDPAEVTGTIFSPEPGNRWFAIYVTMEATGSGIANTGEWWLTTTDGAEFTNMFTLGDVPEIGYTPIEPGTTTEGRVMFEIPEDAEVAWILLSPTIFLGENLVFVN
ncbi:MAG TPA: DUF4352 domain-containing protein [Thermomicrobiales bacterium]|nr:DUF4352 domain-containing protein [Thermomicrobiales bacterium]